MPRFDDDVTLKYCGVKAANNWIYFVFCLVAVCFGNRVGTTKKYLIKTLAISA